MSVAICAKAKRATAAIAMIAAAVFSPVHGSAETLESALAYAYSNNPQLNSQRALVRATDEAVPEALAGYRPKVSWTASIGRQYLGTTIREIGSTTLPGTAAVYFTQKGMNTPHGVGATVTQNLLNGFQTSNKTRLAEAQVLAARETLRTTEQQVLLSAVNAYMNLLREGAIVELRRNNLSVLQEQLRQAKVRLESGNVTATDVSQAEARVATGRTDLFVAEAAYASAKATYRQVIGLNPIRPEAATPIDRFSPRTLPAATTSAVTEHPTVTTAQFNVDIALQQVKIAEGALYPTVNIQGSVQKSSEISLTQIQSYTAGAAAQISAPVYQGGSEYAAIRQAKETAGQRHLDLDVARDQARMTVAQAWAQLESAKSSIESTKAQVKAAEAALSGVREEARLGQRTTLDVLNAQQELVSARIAMVVAERDRVVNSYALLAAVGRLSPQSLGLPVVYYDPTVHYHQVRDVWVGMRTPDGR